MTDRTACSSDFGVGEQQPGSRTAVALLAGAAAWIVTLYALLAVGLLTGAWQPTAVDLADVADVGILPAAVALVLIGLPVALLVRDRLVLPLSLSACWLLYFATLGGTQGPGVVRGVFVGLLYGTYWVWILPLAAAVEYLLRRLVGRRGGTTDA